jgi:RNA polymerase sigma-70 factor (ECF subfamily)
MSPAGDDDLVERLRRAQPAALGEIYDALHVRVRAFARRLVGDDAEAEDLVQEAFLALPGAMRSYRGDGALLAFVFGLVVNHARHHVRAAARRRAAHLRSGSEEPAPASTPEEHADRRELARALLQALDELSFDQRVAVVLCEVEERTSAEAAAIAGVPEGTIRTRVFHAKKRLRAVLEERGVR